MARRPRKYRLRRLILGGVLGVLVAGVALVGLFYIYVDHVVTQQFKGRRWTLPAQVFAAPLELYVGAPLSMSDLTAELARLQYRAREQLDRPGSYHLQNDRIDIALRATRFADEMRVAQTLSIVAGPRSIEVLRDSGGHDLPILRLDPLLIGSIFPSHGEDRIVVTPAEVPALLPAALKAVEDRKFDTHHGVDPAAVARAVWIDLRSHQIAQGGSTLTQQLVKSYFLDSRQTIGRKAREALMAIALESHFSKADLMNAYINEIYLGQDGDRAVHGFGLASQFYFGKPLGEIDLSELSLLVAIVRGPSYYDPRRHPERALARRNLVLKLMADLSVITAQDAQSASSRPLGVTNRGAGAYYPSYLDFVRRTLRRDYRESDLTQEGLKIFTSLEPRAQDEAEQTLDRELTRLERSRRPTSASLDGAIVITAPASGDVIAIVGGRRVGYSGFNRALDAARPIGSLVKPFVYLTALETHRYNLASIVQDAPVDIRLPNGGHWRPVNFTHQTYGPVPLVRALAESLNLATVAVGMDIGVTHVAQTLQRFGLERAPAQVPALLLGAVNATPVEVAQLYTGLANGGYRTPLRAVRAVISASGEPLKAFPLELTPIAQPDVVFEVDQMMQQVIERGTGRAARTVLPADLVVVGKSGSTSDLRDSWFAGFSGSHLEVVWVGYDDNHPTGFTGAAAALAVWSRVLAGLGTTSWSAATPESLTDVSIDYLTGLQLEAGCKDKNSNAIRIAVPVSTQLAKQPGCVGAIEPGFAERLGERLRAIIHK
jgi:penicillin-binding protein 1B